LEYLEGLLGGLTREQRDKVLDAAVIWELAVEEPEHPGAREALAHKGERGCPDPYRRGGQRLGTVVRHGREARETPGGHDLAGWLNELRGVGLVVAEARDNPAGRLESRRAALQRYAERLVREARELTCAPSAPRYELRLDQRRVRESCRPNHSHGWSMRIARRASAR
jgi:hypothetical protein